MNDMCALVLRRNMFKFIVKKIVMFCEESYLRVCSQTIDLSAQEVKGIHSEIHEKYNKIFNMRIPNQTQKFLNCLKVWDGLYAVLIYHNTHCIGTYHIKEKTYEKHDRFCNFSHKTF